MLHKALYAKSSPIGGMGLFTNFMLPKGTIIWEQEAWEKHYTLEEIKSWSVEEQEAFWQVAYATSNTTWHGPRLHEYKDPYCAVMMELYWNHSCDPNCGYDGDTRMVAMRDIQRGEEIVYDYVMNEIDAQFLESGEILTPRESFSCTCGATNCRGNASGALVPGTARYEKYLPYLMSHVRERLTRLKTRPLLRISCPTQVTLAQRPESKKILHAE